MKKNLVKNSIAALVISGLSIVGGYQAAVYSFKKEPSDKMGCFELVDSKALDILPGWSLKCGKINYRESSSPGEFVGISFASSKEITLDPELGEKSLGVLEHEIAHGWAEEHLSKAQKKQFADNLSMKDFYDETYILRPSEIWARTWENCSGHYPIAYESTILPCEALWEMGAPKEKLNKPVLKKTFEWWKKKTIKKSPNKIEDSLSRQR